MGYPMTYQRVVKRNHLEGDYEESMVAGDLRRLERNSRDILQLTNYARIAGITTEQAKAVLDAFFDGAFGGTMDIDEYLWLRERVKE